MADLWCVCSHFSKDSRTNRETLGILRASKKGCGVSVKSLRCRVCRLPRSWIFFCVGECTIDFCRHRTLFKADPLFTCYRVFVRSKTVYFVSKVSIYRKIKLLTYQISKFDIWYVEISKFDICFQDIAPNEVCPPFPKPQMILHPDLLSRLLVVHGYNPARRHARVSLT